MLRKRWAAVALAAMVIGSAAPPATPATAAGHRAVSAVVTPAGAVTPVDPATPVDTVTLADPATPAGAVVGAAPIAGIEAIFGPDNRTPVDPTTTFPASATVLLVFPGGQCTGFLISERTVATAGHCVHSGGSSGTWRTGIVAYPGHDGTTAPFGSCGATQLFAPQGWTGRSNAPGVGDPAYDYGAVLLNCAIGSRTGWYDIGYTTRSLTGFCTATQGYPAGRPGQWKSTDLVRAENANLIYVQHDFTIGQDGSPVFYTPDPDDWCPLPPPPLDIPCPCPPPPPCVCPIPAVLGILASGPYGSGPGLGNNLVTRITQPAYQNFQQWRR